jgi:hypothetical protein
MSAHYRWIATLLAASALAACASTPPRGAPPAPAASTASTAAAPTQRVYVTGSRIPQAVDPRVGLPETGAPAQSFSRDDLSMYGLFDTASGLRDLVPALR